MPEYGEKPRSYIAVRRVRGARPAQDDPGITFPPVTVTPEDCDGCDPGLTVVVDGQAVIASLSACDDDTCYYDYPVTGIV